MDLRSITPLVVVLSMAGAGCTSAPSDPETAAIRRIILHEVSHHPRMEPRDLYKLLHQAAMGSEHVMDDTVGVRLWMSRELMTMGEEGGDVAREPMIDTIAPGGRVVLVQLRPWVAAGRSTDSLLTAFIRTAAAIRPDTALLESYLAVADTLARAGALPFREAAWRELVDGQRRADFPAVHHSDAFVQAYRPAYRVVAGALVP
jgi:hypothetical protein